jgi:oligoribonuclease NrnB/cAMP/cGMP phosphodiesterase (DHH superfamily)
MSENVSIREDDPDTEQALGRLRTLRHEITVIAERNDEYRKATDISVTDLQAHEQRRERLREIVEELRNMQVTRNEA